MKKFTGSVHTGHQLFDEQTDCLATGNVSARTQFSWFVRGANTTECNGFTFEPGELRNRDLQRFRGRGLPSLVETDLAHFAKRDVILYEFYYWQDGKRVVLGYVATDTAHRRLVSWCSRSSGLDGKRVLDAVTEYICAGR